MDGVTLIGRYILHLSRKQFSKNVSLIHFGLYAEQLLYRSTVHAALFTQAGGPLARSPQATGEYKSEPNAHLAVGYVSRALRHFCCPHRCSYKVSHLRKYPHYYLPTRSFCRGCKHIWHRNILSESRGVLTEQKSLQLLSGIFFALRRCVYAKRNDVQGAHLHALPLNWSLLWQKSE